MVGAVAWIAIGAAAFFLFQSEKRIIERRAAVRVFDLHAREAADALADVRAGQQAYVAAGQGVAFWMPKVAATVETLTQEIADLRQSAGSAGARSALNDAATTMAEFATVDKRARDYIKGGQQLMAADVVFTEGGETAALASRQIEGARLAEHQAFDAFEAAARKQEAMALAGAAGLAALAIALLVMPAGTARPSAEPEVSASTAIAGGLSLREESPKLEAATPRVRSTTWSSTSPVLKAAADLCTDFGRVHDLTELGAVLGRAAEMMDASGIVVWVGNTSGGDMRPMLAHGYSAQVLARMPTVPRAADNAAAASYRTGLLQIVLARPGVSSGAIVAPLLSPDGCVGALSAEIRGGGETSDSVQALATIFAAQLAGVLNTAPAEAHRAAGSL